MKDQIIEAIEYLDIDINECSDANELYESIDHTGTMHEIIDGMIDIYYHDLRKWSVDNFEWIDNAIEEGLTDSADFHKMIQSGQYLYYENQAQDLTEEIFTELMEKTA